MKSSTLFVVLVLLIGVIASGCAASEVAPEIPPLESQAQMPATDPSPTEPALETTEISPTPTLPTATPKPSLPPALAHINYRTLGQLEPLFRIPLDNVIDLEFSPDHRYLRMRVQEAEEAGTDIFLDLVEGENIFSIEGGGRTYFNPDSSDIAVLDGNRVTLIDLDTANSRVIYTSRYLAAALSPDGRTLVELEIHEGENQGSTLHVVDLTKGEELYQIYLNAVLDWETLQFDGDGKLLAASYLVPPGTYVAAVWDAKRGFPVYTIYGFSEITLHPFGSEVALANAKQNYISLVSTVTWQQKLYLGPAGEGPVFFDLAYASGGRLIYALSGEEGAEAAFWYPPSGERLDFDPGLDLLAVAISQDRMLLAASKKSGEVVIWGIPE